MRLRGNATRRGEADILASDAACACLPERASKRMACHCRVRLIQL